MHKKNTRFLPGIVACCVIFNTSQMIALRPATADSNPHGVKRAPSSRRTNTLPPGIPKLWEDRGELTPSKVYWGAASLHREPLSRLPAPPFSHFEKDDRPNARSPKAKVVDSKGVKWTIKLGAEVHSDVAAPLLAWALGFGAVESYYVGSGKIEGISKQTDLGGAKGWIEADGSLKGGGRFKRHNKDAAAIQDSKGQDLTWDEAANPGVPAEQLSGLLLFDVLVHNWDSQQKNCKILRVAGKSGPENWYVISDMGASFADKPWNKFSLAGYQKEKSFVKGVSTEFVELDFTSSIRSNAQLHHRIPLAHARWFRKQLVKLTDEDIQAAFDAAFATAALNRAYASGDAAAIRAAREHELSAETRGEIAGFVAVLRSKIDEFMQKVPEN